MKTSTSKKKYPPYKRKIKLSDGSVLVVSDNRKKDAMKMGKPKLNPTIPDPEEAAHVKDEHDKLRYPPPQKNKVFREKWATFLDNIVQRENFKPGHLDLLEVLCELYVDLAELSKFIRCNGQSFEVITITGKSRRMYPEVAQRDKIRKQIENYSKQLDLFPKKDKSPKSGSKQDEKDWS